MAGRRPYQEDAVHTESLGGGRTLLALADGMGGHAAGEVASALALETLVEALGSDQDLASAFRVANDRVHRKADEQPGRRGMGTTLVAVLIEGDELRIANVGDSRAYLLSGEGIRRLTQDHSYVAEAVRRGQSEEEAMAAPWKDALTRSIGIEPSVEVDLFGPLPVERDSALLLCSDGLYKTLPDAELLRLYLQSGGPKGAAQTLVSEAFDSGSDDNISVVIAEFGEVPRARTVGTMPLEYDAPEDGPPEDGSTEDAPGEDAPIADASADRHPAELGSASGAGRSKATEPGTSPFPKAAVVAIALALLVLGFLVLR